MSQRERTGIGDAGRKGRQELVRVFGFPSESADDSEVDVLREAGLTPALKGQATDETKPTPRAWQKAWTSRAAAKIGFTERGGGGRGPAAQRARTSRGARG